MYPDGFPPKDLGELAVLGAGSLSSLRPEDAMKLEEAPGSIAHPQCLKRLYIYMIL